jgi:flagellar hook assembly protein FlgD
MEAQQRFNVPTDITDDGDNSLPSTFALNQNYPNPFNPTTTISFSLNKRQIIDLSIYNLLGQKVRTLYSGWASAGNHDIKWDATNYAGEKVASGIYFYKLSGDEETASRKMTLLK